MPTHRAPRRDRFFLRIATAQLLIVLLGFGGNAILEGQELPPITFIVVLHGLITGSWFLLLVLQTFLIAQRSVRLHMGLGGASIALLAGILITGVLVMIGAYRRHPGPDAAFIVSINLVNLFLFACFYGAAFRLRRKADPHKRYMMFAGIALLPPALGRLAACLGIPDGVALLVLLAFLVVMLGHDLRRARRVHGATLVGCASIIGGGAAGIAVGGTEIWQNLVQSWLG